MSRPRMVLLGACLAAALAAGCSATGGATGAAEGDELRVVATTTQVADFARNVGGDQVQVTSLLKPGVDAHDFEPSPTDLDTIARADLVLENGVGLEGWLDDTIKSSGFTGPVVDTSQGVKLRNGGHAEEGQEQAGGGEEHDPHIWQNPRNAQIMAANIQRALSEAEPAGAATFKANLDTYTKQLQALDVEVERQIDSLANKKLVTNHDAFGYYIDRYGLEFVGSVIPSFDTSTELSGKDVRDLVARIKATKVKAVFSETTLPPKAAQTIAAEGGVKVVTGEDALYGDALGPPGSDGDTYLKMVRHNTATIVSNLSGT
ncbi:MAG TPA: metal ABC transporter substrate-binding protein [Actinomycetes bacterium]|nr:metal ABC transporter substrate-binding protein [Actinomycetes bacterium]